MNPMGKYSGQGPRPTPSWAQPRQLPTGPQVMPGMDLGQPMAPPPGMGGPGGSMPAPNTPQVSLPAQGPGPYVPPGAMPGQGPQQAGMGGMSWQQGPPPARPFTPRTGPLMADALQARAGGPVR
jgi:hypothetical protein